jgi:hypothetical protein
MSVVELDFDDPALVRAIEAMTPQSLDQQGFGIVRLDAAGVVTYYSAEERRLSGFA